MQAIARLAAAGLLAMGLCGCASTMMDDRQSPMPYENRQTVVQPHKPLQCVPYAREHSGIKIYGDAYTWWDQAAGKYPRTPLPEEGTVMVLNNYAGPTRGHVAVVRATVSAREIRVDHANWLNDGAIYLNNPVEDVSSGNDWSLVRVFNLKTGSWGGRQYPVQGFIGGRGEDGRPDLVAGGTPRGATTLVGEIN